jgi:hypothetical protein
MDVNKQKKILQALNSKASYGRNQFVIEGQNMKNDHSSLLSNDRSHQKYRWYESSFKKKNLNKRFSSLEYGLCLFNMPIEKLELPKLDVDSCDYDPVYERTVRQQDAKILYRIDDVLVDLAEKHFDVALSAFALEAVLLSPHFHQKMEQTQRRAEGISIGFLVHSNYYLGRLM